MRTPSLLTDITRIVAHSAAHVAVEDCLERLDRALGGSHVLWLVDYQHGSLTPVTLGAPLESVRVDDSWPGRCFAAQTVLNVREESALLVPVVARGDRFGVLERRGPRADGELQDELEAVASVLALALSTRDLPTEAYERCRRTRPLTLAAELQWSLLPGRAYRDEAVSVGGSLEPAYAIAGDAYDWSRDGSDLAVCVMDGTGRGVPAALTTILALTALRNARASGLSLADQAALSDQALYSHYGGEAFVSALLLQLDVETGALAIIDAGSPMLLRVRGNDIEHIELEAQLPLGMFEETIFVEQQVQLEPKDRLVIVSDGVHASQLSSGGSFGDRRLEQVVADARLLSAGELTRHLVRALRDSLPAGSAGRVDDDAAVVCVDWPGPRRD